MQTKSSKKKLKTISMHTHRSQELWGGDGGAVSVQLDSTSQVKVTDLDWGDLAMAEHQGY